MADDLDTRFFKALATACRAADAAEGPLGQAIDRALETGTPADMAAARGVFDATEPGLKDRLLRQAHLQMATDLSAIWDSLPGAPRGTRPN